MDGGRHPRVGLPSLDIPRIVRPLTGPGCEGLPSRPALPTLSLLMARLPGLLLLCALAALPARAADPLNSSDKPSTDEPASAQPHNELNFVPIVGGSSDVGIGGGFFGGLARLQKGYDPYVWNLEAAGIVTFKGGPDGLELPVQDLYVKLTVPRFLGIPVRLEVRPSYTWEILRYYGLGNAAPDATRTGAATSFVSYRRLHPQLDLDLRFRLVDHVALRGGVRYTQNWLQTKAGTLLVQDQQGGDAETRKLLGSFDSHGVILLKTGLQWDNRDNELTTHSGGFHELNVRFSPGGSAAFPYRYANTNFIGRVFLPLWKPRLTFAVRLVADLLLGEPPFYELSRFEDTYALGGGGGVRGVPAQRYYGKVKLFENAELRSELVSFHALGKPLVFGLVGFFDAGRAWADTRRAPRLDGDGAGIKYGAGGGIRLQSGSAFVVRFDVAYSPDANPVGAYFSAGEAF